MKKLIIITVFLFVGLFQSGVNAQGKIAYANPQMILSEMPEIEGIQDQISTLIQRKNAEFETTEQAIMARFQQLQEEFTNGVISESQFNIRRSELQEELSEAAESTQTEIMQQQNRLIIPLLQRIDRAIADVANELGLDYVLNQMTNEGDFILLFISEEGRETLNINNLVIQKLN